MFINNNSYKYIIKLLYKFQSIVTDISRIFFFGIKYRSRVQKLVLFFCFSYALSFSATYVVDNIASDVDDGIYTVGNLTLREAVNLANAGAGGDVINFNLGGAGPYTITLNSSLTITTNSLTINGFSETGASANTTVLFSGSALNPIYKVVLSNSGPVLSAFVVSGNYNTIKGFVIPNFGDGPAASSNDIAINISGNFNQISGNYIGVGTDGATKAIYTAYGISISGANNNIGDGTPAGVNLISGMNAFIIGGGGILITGAAATANTIKGNLIGLQKDGVSLIAGSQLYGISITGGATYNNIGGTNSGEGNVISGSSGRGVNLNSNYNTVHGNIIGPTSDGMNYISGNSQDFGIYISAANNTIGGTVSGARNIISGNWNSQGENVRITGASATGNFIKGNYIGLNSAGTDALSGIVLVDSPQGIVLITNPSQNIIGGTAVSERNIISGNNPAGIFFLSSANNNTVIGNYIGTQSDGVSALTSNFQSIGIQISTSSNNTIGGSAANYKNIIAGYTNIGINYSASGSNNLVKGNYIGVGTDGQTVPGSPVVGFSVTAQTNSTIGGTNQGEGNIISGNSLAQIKLNTTSCNNITIKGNIIGLAADGINLPSAIGTYGIYCGNSYNNTIGGTGTYEKNTISGNDQAGIYITNASSSSNLIKGNYIGMASNGTSSVLSSSQDYGIHITSSSNNNTIGGSLSGEFNKIAYSTADGIYITGAATSSNLISRNLIYGNTNKAINLNSSGNANYASPTVFDNFTANTVSGIAAANDIIEVFESIISSSITTSAVCQSAENYLGTTTADGSGNWSLGGLTLTSKGTPLATARNPSNNNTSELGCPTSITLPIELLFFSAKKINETTVKTYWQTATEINNDYFTVEVSLYPSKERENWLVVGIVSGAGNSTSLLNYELFHHLNSQYSPLNTLYYRLKQTDIDGSFSYSDVIAVEYQNNRSSSGFQILTNPNEGKIKVQLNNWYDKNVHVLITDILGRHVYENDFLVSDNQLIELYSQVNLSDGIFLLTIYDKNGSLSKRFIVN